MQAKDHKNDNGIEIVFIGPSYGESILIKDNENNWFVIDSCIDLATKESLPLKYLSDVGVNTVERVKMIIITHWHDDHIRGISQLCEKCDNASIVIPLTFGQREFVNIFSYSITDELGFRRSGNLREMLRVINVVDQKQLELIYAKQNETIFQSNNSENKLSIFALSPGNLDYRLSCSGIARAYKSILDGGRLHDDRINPNLFSIALLIKIGKSSLLLGGDLEVHPDPRRGIDNALKSHCLSDNISGLYKVAHHGSKTAYHKQLGQSLRKDNFSIITPWRKGRNAIPTCSEIELHKQHSDQLFITAKPRNSKPIKKRSNMIDKAMRDATNFRYLYSVAKPGHIIMKAKYSDLVSGNNKWEIALSNQSEKL
ncbi:MBL fold metallo-hydrolase [Marispirochaeta sp.]|uniref:MBL fold metallo-hydrolase n=1 Tax=Marispirochaeta sp. TaxID=2038653 RepID=UPI0029C60201|nr:MBL fold metallo-hydrolase [Marispirochaeta sp.]